MLKKVIIGMLGLFVCIFAMAGCSNNEDKAEMENVVSEAKEYVFNLDDEVELETYDEVIVLPAEDKQLIIDVINGVTETFTDAEMDKREELATPNSMFYELDYTIKGNRVSLEYSGSVENYEFIAISLLDTDDAVIKHYRLKVPKGKVADMESIHLNYF